MKCSKGKLCVDFKALMNNDKELGLLSPWSQPARLRILMLFSYPKDRRCHVEALGCFGGETDCCFPSETVRRALLTPWQQKGRDWARHSEVRHLPCVLAGRNMYLHFLSPFSVCLAAHPASLVFPIYILCSPFTLQEQSGSCFVAEGAHCLVSRCLRYFIILQGSA